MTPLLIVAALPLLIWIYMLIGRGGFWRATRLTLAAQDPAPASARVAVVIPARDEAQSIGPCVAALLRQQERELHVYLVDDGSTDSTAEAARSAARSCARDADLTVISSRPLPAGWTGKLWAVEQGIERAAEFAPEFILLTDADILHSAGSLARLIGLARRGDFDLTSLMVRLSCQTAAERWLIPAFVFFFFMLYPPRWIADPRSRTAGAAGGCMLVRREMLERLGGIEKIRGEIIDDCALARLVKRSGGRIWLGLADDTASLRSYVTAADVGNMIARTAFSQLRHSAVLLVLTIVGLCACFVLPVGLLFTGNRLALAAGAAAWLAMSFCYLPTIRYYRLPAWRVLTLPAAAVFYLGATLLSAVRFWTGRGGQWKGRVQDVAS